MNIHDIFILRTKHLNSEMIDSYNYFSDESIKPTASHIFLEKMPGGSDYDDLAINVLKNIIKESKKCTTFYLNEISDEFLYKLQSRFDTFQKPDGVTGMIIQNISEVGYVISIIPAFNGCMIYDYNEDDYISKMNEIVVLGIAKQELHYIYDWVKYHLHVGFDRIYLIDNNDESGERYDEVLKSFIEKDQVKIIDARGKKFIQNQYYNALYYALPFKWISIIDIDEYIWFNETGKYCDIKTFLNDICKDNDRFGIMLQWHCYAPSGEDHPSDKHIWEANNKPLNFNARKDARCEYINDWCKSIYKSSYPIECNEHFAWQYSLNNPNSNIVKMVNCDDNGILKSQLIYISEDEFKNQSVYIKHFLLRNIDDFFHRKYMRGHAGGDFGIGQDGWAFYQWKQNINYYTDLVDNITPMEQDYLERHGMKPNYTFHPDVFVNLYIIDENEYINRAIIDIIYNSIAPNTNIYLMEYHIKYPICSFDNLKYIDMNSIKKWDVCFFSDDYYIYHCHDMHMSNIESYVRKNKQEPIIINIGIPSRYGSMEIPIEEQERYINTLKAIFNWSSLRNILRDVLENNRAYIPQFGIETENSIIMNESDIKEFVDSNGLYIPRNNMVSNTIIMSYTQFKKYKKVSEDFFNKFGWMENQVIYNQEASGMNTVYHKLMSIISSTIEKPYFVWSA